MFSTLSSVFFLPNSFARMLPREKIVGKNGTFYMCFVHWFSMQCYVYAFSLKDIFRDTWVLYNVKWNLLLFWCLPNIHKTLGQNFRLIEFSLHILCDRIAVLNWLKEALRLILDQGSFIWSNYCCFVTLLCENFFAGQIRCFGWFISSSFLVLLDLSFTQMVWPFSTLRQIKISALTPL